MPHEYSRFMLTDTGPMDFADGIVVVTADALNVSTIFTIDTHIYAYRRSNGDVFTVIRG